MQIDTVTKAAQTVSWTGEELGAALGAQAQYRRNSGEYENASIVSWGAAAGSATVPAGLGDGRYDLRLVAGGSSAVYLGAWEIPAPSSEAVAVGVFLGFGG